MCKENDHTLVCVFQNLHRLPIPHCIQFKVLFLLTKPSIIRARPTSLISTTILDQTLVGQSLQIDVLCYVLVYLP